jgi:hypothetical protein
LSFRPLLTGNSLEANYNNLNDFMRNADRQLDRLYRQFETSGTPVSLVKASSVTTASAPLPHGLGYVPDLLYRIENTTAPGVWHQGRYQSFNLATGSLDIDVYMTADTTNIYLNATTPSGGALYGSLLTLNAVYWVIGGR